nr:lipocalin Ory c 2 precursor [Oryctolagus cuniculus cuniculus]
MVTMKALLLALAVGVACAVDPAQVSGSWRTAAIASDSPALTADGGRLRVLLRHLQCSQDCRVLTVTFYTRQDGVCLPHTVVAQAGEDGVYEAEFEGRNRFRVLQQDDGHLVFLNRNEARDGAVTHVTLAAGQDQELSDEDLARFAALTEQNGIPRDNVERVAGTDTCAA